MKKKISAICVLLLAAVMIAASLTGCSKKSETDYSNPDLWAYYSVGEDKPVDLFLVAPCIDMSQDEYNMSLDNEELKASMLGALNMERGIYDENTRMFSPYYRQASIKAYLIEPEEREQYLELAYSDVSAAFSYYIEHENNGRPIILAGFSEGADMCYRLLEEYFGSRDMQNRLVAVYAIGWPCSYERAEKYSQIVPAKGEFDTGVVVSFECESPELKGTFIVPEGSKNYTINPLNWMTDGTPADKSENLGACFTDYGANIKSEVPELCGCYIDTERGVLKVPDVDPSDYPAYVPGLPEGSYHIYDYQFFFRNLQRNVQDRIRSYQGIDVLDKNAIIREFGGDLDSNLSIFPDSIPGDAEITYSEIALESGLFDTDGRIIISCKYNAAQYAAEKERLSAIEMDITYRDEVTYTNRILYDTESYNYPAYIANEGFGNTYEYALLSESTYEITYIYLAYPVIEEFEFPDYLMKDLTRYDEENTYKAFTIYNHSFDGGKSYIEFDD